MFKSYRLPYITSNEVWSISPVTGSLLRYEREKYRAVTKKLPDIISKALYLCDQPFECKWSPNPAKLEYFTKEKKEKLLAFDSVLNWIGSERFFLSKLYGSWRSPLFNNTLDAFSAVAQLPSQIEKRAVSCLQRTLLVAKTSKSFPGNGVLLIGASLDCVDMHAWIIEDSTQPDHQDRTWINYRPLLAMVIE